MSLTTIEIGANSYQAYASVAEADAYLIVDPVRGDIWIALDESRKQSYLIAATRRLDLMTWVGRKTDPAQETEWPRKGVTLADGSVVPSDALPAAIEEATILLAGTIASTPAASQAGSGGNQFKRLKAGSAEVEYVRGSSAPALNDAQALARLRAAGLFGAGGSITGSTFGGLASGTDEESRFGDGYRLGRGYS